MMSFNADSVLEHANIGGTLIFSGLTIAEIIQKSPHQVEIKDTHGKHWQINRVGLLNVTFSSFLADLSAAITRFWSRTGGLDNAREALAKLTVGEDLLDQGEPLATLVHIDLEADQGPALTFKDRQGNLHCTRLGALPLELSLGEYIHRFTQIMPRTPAPASGPLLLRYFQEEFIPKMLDQMHYDHNRWGDTWLMRTQDGQEDYIWKRFNEYFQMFAEFDKQIPWLKIAGYAVIAQAREDHPQWMF